MFPCSSSSVTLEVYTKRDVHAMQQPHTHACAVWQGLVYSISGGWDTSSMDHEGLFVARGDTASPALLIPLLRDALQVMGHSSFASARNRIPRFRWWLTPLAHLHATYNALERVANPPALPPPLPPGGLSQLPQPSEDIFSEDSSLGTKGSRYAPLNVCEGLGNFDFVFLQATA